MSKTARQKFFGWLVLGVAVLGSGATALVACGSANSSGGSGSNQALRACNHICTCVMPGDATCSSGCESSTSDGSASFSFSTTTASIGYSMGNQANDAACLSCLASASCDQINAGTACTDVCGQ